MVESVTLSDNEEKFSQVFRAYVQSGNINFLIGSGASMPAIPLASNIEAEMNHMLSAGNEDAANLRALSFIEDIEQKNIAVSGGFDYDGTEQSLSQYVDFLIAIDQVLFERKNLLLPRQASIFTTNYDTFIEHAASHLSSLILNDGFDRTSSLTGNFPFRPERYFDRTYRSGPIYTRQAEVPTINLIKLHGSLTWRKSGIEIIFRKNNYKPLTGDEKTDPSAVAEALRDRALIIPNLRKFDTTIMDRVYYDLLRIFANAMDRENAILISYGFSFADEHILDITKRALRNPTSQLISFAYNSDSAQDIGTQFSSQRNALVVTPEDGDIIDFGKFNSVLQKITGDSTNADG